MIMNRIVLSVSAIGLFFGAWAEPALPAPILCPDTSALPRGAPAVEASDGAPTPEHAPELEAPGRQGDLEFDHTLGTGQEIDPFGATPHEVVAEMLALAEVDKEDVVYDLGSGDGRIPIAAATEAGARGVGVELRPELVKRSRKAAEEAGVADRVRFLKKDFFEVDISEATVVMLYLFPRTTVRLRPKLLEELEPGTRIVAYNYGIEGWPRDKEQPVEALSYGTLYYWVVPANVSGSWEGLISLGSEGGRRFTLQFDQTFQQVRGHVMIGDEQLPLHDVELEADNLTFTLSLPGEERLMLAGKVAGGRMRGVVRPAQSNGGEQKWTWRVVRDPATKTSIDPGLPAPVVREPK